MEVKVQATALCNGDDIKEIKETPLKTHKARDHKFDISNIIFERDYDSNKHKFYPFLFNEACIELSNKTGIGIDIIRKQINTILIDFQNGNDGGKKDVIEVGENGELFY